MQCPIYTPSHDVVLHSGGRKGVMYQPGAIQWRGDHGVAFSGRLAVGLIIMCNVSKGTWLFLIGPFPATKLNYM